MGLEMCEKKNTRTGDVAWWYSTCSESHSPGLLHCQKYPQEKILEIKQQF
jgi:hypothetical protein